MSVFESNIELQVVKEWYRAHNGAVRVVDKGEYGKTRYAYEFEELEGLECMEFDEENHVITPAPTNYSRTLVLRVDGPIPKGWTLSNFSGLAIFAETDEIDLDFCGNVDSIDFWKNPKYITGQNWEGYLYDLNFYGENTPKKIRLPKMKYIRKMTTYGALPTDWQIGGKMSLFFSRDYRFSYKSGINTQFTSHDASGKPDQYEDVEWDVFFQFLEKHKNGYL